MIRDNYVWRRAIRRAQSGALNAISALDLLIYEYGQDYVKKMDKKSLAELINELYKESGDNVTYSAAEKEVEAWYQTA